MEIRCRCTGCSAKFKVEGKYAGKKARCPKCQAVVDVPLTSGDETVTVSPVVGPTPSTVAPTLPASSSKVPAPKPGTTTVAIPVSRTPAPPPSQPDPPAATPSLTFSESPAPFVVAGSTVASFTPSSDPTPAPADEFPALKTTPPGSHKATSAKSATSPTRGRKKASPLPLIIGGALTVLVAGAAVVFIINSGGSGQQVAKGTGKNGTTAKDATLHLDWPQDQRPGGSLVIDGRRRSVPISGDIKLTLPPGEHHVILLRRGFDPFDTKVTLTKGEEERLAPAWKASSISAVTTPGTPAVSTPATPLPMPAVGSGDFPIGTAVRTPSIKGFDGWYQMLEQAKDEAAQSKKDLLIVFGCSDAQRATQELARELETADVKKSHVCVMIDFPRTAAGMDTLADAPQNQLLLEEFGIRSLPTLALTDDQGRAYFMKREWESGFGVGSKLADWAKEKAERDTLLAAAAQGNAQEQLAAAAKAVKWIQDKAVWRSYPSEVERWMTAAQQADPENKQALLEVFFEPSWFLDVVQANEEDVAAVTQVTSQLDPWITRKFHDPDRGAKLHLVAAQLLVGVERFDEGMAQLDLAAKYQPKDADLARSVTAAKQAVKNKDVLGNGTGFLISPDGYVLTNKHVADAPGKIEIKLPGVVESIPAEVVAKSETRDIALLKFTPPADANLPVLAISGEAPGRGKMVAAFGYPLARELGSGVKLTDGLITGLPDDSNDSMFVLSVKINPGNSGGPLCDAQGSVVGMITAKTRADFLGAEDSYGLAIPAADLMTFLKQHLPAGTRIAAPGDKTAALSWDEVDRKVSGGVLMVVIKKPTP